MEITVVTLVEEQMSSWKGNLPKLPIIIKYSAIGTRKYSGRGNLIDSKSISSESNSYVTQPGSNQHIPIKEFTKALGSPVYLGILPIVPFALYSVPASLPSVPWHQNAVFSLSSCKTSSISWKSWPPTILDPSLLDQTHQHVQDPHDPIVDYLIDISPEGFLSSILLWLVVIVAVVGVGVMVVVVVETFEAKWDLRLPLPGIFSNVLEIIPLHCQMVEAKEFHKDRDFFQLSTSSKIHLASFGASLGLLVLSVFCPVSGCVQKLAETLLA
ncbi:hypothetical protein Tco_1236123 [Tanacetum coccineum]